MDELDINPILTGNSAEEAAAAIKSGLPRLPLVTGPTEEEAARWRAALVDASDKAGWGIINRGEIAGDAPGNLDTLPIG